MFKNKRAEILFLILLMFIGGYISLWAGQATHEFDVYNYHIYAPWALLNDRIGIDVLPCGIRSYFNPILDMPYHFLIKYFNHMPRLVGFIQGFWYGAVVFCGYKISTIFEFPDKFKKISFVAFCTLLVALTPIIMFESGTLYNDLPICVLICSAIYFYLKYLFRSNSDNKNHLIIVGSFILGACSGLKLTSSIMIVAIAATVCIFTKEINRFKKVFILSTIGFITGFVILNGYWYMKMWIIFKNPVFPYFNNLFHSPYGIDAMILNDSYIQVLPQNIFIKIFYPFIQYFKNNIPGFGSWIFKYQDLRISLVAIILPILFIRYFKKTNNSKSENVHSINEQIAIFLALFILITYAIWINVFPIARYILPLFVTGSILIGYYLCVITNKFSGKYAFLLSSVLLLIIICTYSSINIHFLRKHFSDKIFDIVNYPIKDNSLVLLASHSTSYVIPYLNSRAKYYHLVIPEQFDVKKHGRAYIYNKTRTIDYYYSKYYEDELKSTINNYDNLYLIFSDRFDLDKPLYNMTINFYLGKKFTLQDCEPIGPITGICKIIKE